jgi:hypothetical protein
MGILDEDMMQGGTQTQVMSPAEMGIPAMQGPQFPDDEEIIRDVNEAFDKYKHGRANFERNWYRNMLFRHGIQWITMDETSNAFRKRRLPSWVPTPVTNKFAATGERIACVLSRVEPNWNFTPASDSELDIITAENCDDLEPVICEENKIEQIRGKISKWVTYTGNAFVMSGVETKDNNEPSLYSDVYSPLEVYGNITIEDIDNQESIIIVCRKDKGYIKKTFGADVNDSESNEMGLTFLESIAFATQNSSSTFRANSKTRGVVIKIGIFRQCEKYPNGLMTVIGGGKVLDKQELYKTNDNKVLFNIEHFKFDSVPGSFFGSTPMHDLIPKQEQMNRLDSMMELITMRMSSPVWLLPEGTIVKNFSGEPGAQIKYHSMGDNKQAPSRVAGENIPNSLFQWRENINKDFEELANTFEALKGQTPYSGAPNIAIETLIEQGLTRFGPTLRANAECWRRWMKTQMELFRIFDMQRNYVSKGESSEWEMKSFTAANFSGGINVSIESDSTVPRSQHIKQSRLTGAIGMGIIDLNNPMVRMKALQALKLEDYSDDLMNDVLDAVRENELLKTIDPQQVGMMAISGQPPIKVIPFVQNNIIHIAKHRLFAISPEGKPYIDFLTRHITEHDMTQQAMMTGMPQPQSAGPQPPKPGNGGEPKGKPINIKAQNEVAPKGNEIQAAMNTAEKQPIQ